MEELYQTVATYALSKTLYLVGSQEIAQEIVQEVFLRLWNKKLVFQSKESGYQWVYRSCHNAAIDHLKSAAVVSVRHSADHLTLPESISDRTENGQIIARIAAKLSRRQILILAYRFVDGHHINDIAAMIDVSEKTIRRELKAIQLLGMQMKEDEDET